MPAFTMNRAAREAPRDSKELQAWIQYLEDTHSNEIGVKKVLVSFPTIRRQLQCRRTLHSVCSLQTFLAAVLHRRGIEAVSACTYCQSGRSIFTVCVVAPGLLNSSYTSCCFSGRESRCTHYQRIKEKKIRTKRKAKQFYIKPHISLPILQDPYHVAGELYLPDPGTCGVTDERLDYIRKLRPMLEQLYHREMIHIPKTMSDLKDAFSRFSSMEQSTWRSCQWYIPSKSLLVAPSGSLQSSIAHHLHQPSFISSQLEYGETADGTNPSTAMVMNNVFIKGKTLIYDHLLRRHLKSEGLKDYPLKVVQVHEAFVQTIRESMEARVEVVYGVHAQRRLLRSNTMDLLPLWGHFEGIFLLLDRETNYINAQEDHKYRRIVILAAHPQFMVTQQKGSEWTKLHDRLLKAAAQIAVVPHVPKFFERKLWKGGKPPTLSETARLYINEPFGPLLDSSDPVAILPSRNWYNTHRDGINLPKLMNNLFEKDGLVSFCAPKISSRDSQEEDDKEISWKALVRPLTYNDERFTRPVECWCYNCQEQTVTRKARLSRFTDRNPQWTIGNTRPLYIQRTAVCSNCKENGKRGLRQFVPTEPNIPSISKLRLERFERNWSSQYHVEIKSLLLETIQPTSKFTK